MVWVTCAEAGRTVVEALVAGIAGSGQNRRAGVRESVVVLVLRYLVARHVEAGGVGEVEDIEGVLEVVTLGELGQFHKRGIRALLEGLPEDVALPGGEVGFIGIGGGNGTTQAARLKQGMVKQEAFRAGRLRRLQSGQSSRSSRCSREPSGTIGFVIPLLTP